MRRVLWGVLLLVVIGLPLAWHFYLEPVLVARAWGQALWGYEEGKPFYDETWCGRVIERGRVLQTTLSLYREEHGQYPDKLTKVFPDQASDWGG